MTEKQRLVNETYDSIPVPIVIIEQSGLVKYLNTAAKNTDFASHLLQEGVNFFDFFNLNDKQLLTEINALAKGSKEEIIFNNRFKFSSYPREKEKIVVTYLDLTTKLVELEGDLAEKTQLLEGILGSIDGGINVLDSELNIKYVNQTLKDWNLDRLPLVGKKCYQVHHNRDSPCEICPTLKALESGEVVTETIIDKRETEVRFLKVTSYPLQDKESNQPIEVVEFMQDVTKQEKQKEKLRAIYQASEDIAFIIIEPNEKDAKIVEFSPGAEKIFGYHKEEVIGGKTSVLHNQDIVYEFKELYNNLVDGSYWSDKVKLLRKNGEEFPALLTGYPLEMYGRKPATLGVVIDISELEATREEFRLNKLAVDKANLGIYRVNEESKVTYANQHACQQLNYTQEELLGKSVYEIDVNLVPGEMDKVWEAVKAGKVKNRKTYHQAKQGEKIPVQIRIYHVEHNGTDYQYAFVKDITKEEKIKNELKEKNKHLEEARKELLATNKKLSNQLEKGKEIHHHLLPNSLPRFNNVKMASFYRPAEEIGADFYQTIEFDKQILFYVSDVTGHNLDGAFLNIFLRETINSFLTKNYDSNLYISVEEIIDYVIYRYCLESFPDDYFISLALFVIDKDSLEVDYLNAGMHINPFLIKDNKVCRLKAKGMPIANFFESENYYYEHQTINLSDNDTLLITTDGLIESERDGVQFGEKRLNNILQSNHQMPLEILLKEIIDNLEEFMGGFAVKDDVTLLALKKQGYIDSLSMEIASEFELAYEVRKKVKQFLIPYHQKIAEILIGLHEVLINAIEHGNQQKYNDKIEINVCVLKAAIIIEVEDEGKGFNWREKLEQEFSLDNFGERGRGIMLTKEIFDYFAYNQFGNRAIMYLKR